MIASVIYGVYVFFLEGPREVASITVRGDKELDALNAFITKVVARTKKGLSEKQVYTIKKAETPWRQDPLLRIQPKMSEAEKAARQPLVLKTKLLYTGFLQMGNKRLAIINDLEYEVGDELEPGGLILRNIHPNHVVVGSPNHKNKKVVLPMEEIE
jgi:hypothetical protein